MAPTPLQTTLKTTVNAKMGHHSSTLSSTTDAMSTLSISATTATKATKATEATTQDNVDELKKQWDHLDVDFVEQQFLLIIQARNTQQPPSMTHVPVESLRALACKYGVVSLRGFKQDDDLVQVAERVGPVLEWPFGKVFEIKSVADTALTGQTREAMPMHYDGLVFMQPGNQQRSMFGDKSAK
ncbi:hypothetical protein P43SY_001723 [Pythium insidiosum]|uniref:TauD/TfdA-like domain-containing protein n=1 Tax=Pythium insidiosum TaxID=114742 RepID=A0AAD5Q9E9_PYTIN|nr:hypothetical protein P43SY_001723 [Pythium insidiosum]